MNSAETQEDNVEKETSFDFKRRLQFVHQGVIRLLAPLQRWEYCLLMMSVDPATESSNAGKNGSINGTVISK